MQVSVPIDAYEQHIVDTVRDNRVTVIVAETGAGKSTKVPLMLLRAGLGAGGMIGVTEPRRVAAMNVSDWVAQLAGCELGTTVGYQIGGERRIGHDTRVAFLTEGVVLRQLHSDPHLRKYAVLIVDEVHERGMNQDLLIALLRQVIDRRPDLKVVIMSATIDAGKFSEHFGGAPVIQVPGRVYPVSVAYLDETPYGKDGAVKAAVKEITDYVRRGGAGDILCFMPDEKTIKKTCDALDEERLSNVRILPLYGSQDPNEQREVFQRDHRRRIIVSTNIAETSVTIDGVEFVVDSGYIKEVVYVSASMSALEVTEHSKAGCEQRRGRAGRTKPGACLRLFAEEDYASRQDYTKPEIQRMSLDQVLLHLRTLKYTTQQVIDLPWMDPPPAERWLEAEARLKLLGALDEQGEMTADGHRMDRLPLAPMLGRMILTAEQYGCLDELVTIVAGFTSRQVFVRPRGKEKEADTAHEQFKIKESDALTALAVWRAWGRAGENGSRNVWARNNFVSSRALQEIDRNRDQILTVLEREGVQASSTDDQQVVLKAVAAGLIVNVCLKEGGHEYRWQDRHDVYIHPGSALFTPGDRFGYDAPKMMVCAEIVETTRCFARGCSVFDPAWIAELIPASAIEWTRKLERDPLASDADAWRLVELRSWQGIEFGKQKLEEIPAGALSAVVIQMLEDIGGYQTFGLFHPMARQHRSVWKVVRSLTEFQELVALKAKIGVHFTACLEGVRTLAEAQERRVELRLEDYLTSEQAAAHLATAAAEEAADRAEEERLNREHDEREAQKAELKARYDELVARANGFPKETWPDHLDKLVSGLRWKVTSLWYAKDAHGELAQLAVQVDQLEATQEARFTQATEARLAVLAQFPVCPFCAGAWWQAGVDVMACDGEHHHDRLIGRDGSLRPHLIGRFVTVPTAANRDGELVAQVETDRNRMALRFTFGFARPWRGGKFKEVKYEPHALILPPELAQEREQIARDLAELAQARVELEEFAGKLRRLEEEVGQGQVIRLTFSEINGRSAARDGVRMYVAEYGVPYPAPGETWFCRKGAEVPEGGGRVVMMVVPLIRAGSISSVKDIEELEALIRETYPGLSGMALQ